jgi:hypothetical protein
MAKPKLDSTHPEVSKEWHPTKNGELKPSDFTYGSHKEIWWKCLKGDDHEWSARISNRTFKGYGCPCCSGKKTCKDNRLDLLYPEIAKQWHPTNNGDLKPSNFTYGSRKEIWWKCPKGDDHEWETKIKTRTRGHGCPFCSGDKPCKDNRLDLLYPEIAKQWHPTQNGDLKPSDFVYGSNKMVWWKCPKGDDHEWVAVIGSRTTGKRGCRWCARQN